MQAWFEKQWQGFGVAQIVLLPLSWVFYALSSIRKWLYKKGVFHSYQLSVPVIVVGNVTVGGTGKTPLVVYLAEQLKQAGYSPAVISRGYGGTDSGEVLSSSSPQQFGDEPVLIAKRTGVPVWVNVNRVLAGQALLEAHPSCNVIISDDGLQHYRLKRDVEIVVINSNHSLGNQHLLPSGPLREKLSRLNTVNAIVDTGRKGLDTQKIRTRTFNMQLQMQGIFSLDDRDKISLEALKNKDVVAIAGIGHPTRFFNFVKGLGLRCAFQAFDDHHAFTQQDFEAFKHKTVLMTEKDAVKCKQLNIKNAWYMPVNAMLAKNNAQESLIELVVQQLKQH